MTELCDSSFRNGKVTPHVRHNPPIVRRLYFFPGQLRRFFPAKNGFFGVSPGKVLLPPCTCFSHIRSLHIRHPNRLSEPQKCSYPCTLITTCITGFLQRVPPSVQTGGRACGIWSARFEWPHALRRQCCSSGRRRLAPGGIWFATGKAIRPGRPAREASVTRRQRCSDAAHPPMPGPCVRGARAIRTRFTAVQACGLSTKTCFRGINIQDVLLISPQLRLHRQTHREVGWANRTHNTEYRRYADVAQTLRRCCAGVVHQEAQQDAQQSATSNTLSTVHNNKRDFACIYHPIN